MPNSNDRTMSIIFVATFDVRRAESSIMPEGIESAYVTCFASGQGYEAALRKCVDALASDGLGVVNILEPIHSMPISDWRSFCEAQWPEQAGQLPDQRAFEAIIEADKVQYGPFAAYQ